MVRKGPLRNAVARMTYHRSIVLGSTREFATSSRRVASGVWAAREMSFRQWGLSPANSPPLKGIVCSLHYFGA